MGEQLTAEERATKFYDSVAEGGEGAGELFKSLMGREWSHGIEGAERQGLTPEQAAYALKERLITKAGIQPGDHVLEFGAGVGGGTISMAQMTGAHFVGISSSDCLSREARANAQEAGVADRVSFLTVGPFEYRTLAAWPPGSFDAACFSESVCHLPRKDLFMQAAYSRLKPGGVLFGLDWIKRPFGAYQTPQQIETIIAPVCDHFRLTVGTLSGYADLMRDAGFTVSEAVDEFAGVECWGSTPEDDRPAWLERARGMKQALDAARSAGVFSIGWWIATKPE